MSWHYLQEQVEDCLEALYLDGEQFVPWKTIHTASKSSFKDNKTDSSNPSQSGMTLKHSTGSLGVDEFILSLPDFPVKDSVVLVTDVEKMIHGIFGLTRSELLMKYDPNTHFWKMSLTYLIMSTGEESVLTFPKAGICLNGVLYQHPLLEHHTKGKDFGHDLPTPVASEHRFSGSKFDQSRNTKNLASVVGGKVHPEYHEWMMGWPIGWTGLEPLETDRYQQWLEHFGS